MTTPVERAIAEAAIAVARRYPEHAIDWDSAVAWVLIADELAARLVACERSGFARSKPQQPATLDAGKLQSGLE